MRAISWLVLLCVVSACDEQILHDLSEHEANKVLSRLHIGSLSAEKILQSDGRWAIAVDETQVIPALTFLDSNRVLAQRTSHAPSASKGGIVPSREEQWFRYERSVAVSIEESLSTIRGVLEVRVHLNLPEKDPLFGTKSKETGSGSVLLVVDDRYEATARDVARLVSGAAGISDSFISVLQSQHSQGEQSSRSDEEIKPLEDSASSKELVSIPRILHEKSPGIATKNAAVNTPTIKLGWQTSWYPWGVPLGIVAFITTVSLMYRKKRGVRFQLPDSDDVTIEEES